MLHESLDSCILKKQEEQEALADEHVKFFVEFCINWQEENRALCIAEGMSDLEIASTATFEAELAWKEHLRRNKEQL